MKRLPPELYPVLAAAFLAPIIGGQVSLDANALHGGFWQGALGGPELPLAARAILGTLVAIGLGIALVRRRVVQIPSLTLSGLTVLLVGVIGLSVLSSAFMYASYVAWVSWVVYAVCLFGAVATVGRRVGVRALVWAMVAGGTVTALKGIQEFASVRAHEPAHRIFADWNNPNALAGILSILVPLALGLCLTSERIEALGSGLCASFMIFALVFTQSKGGLISTGLAIATLMVASMVWKGGKRVALALVPIAVACVLVAGTMATATTDTGPSPLTRIAGAQASQEQSFGFRLLLWKTAADLVKSKPTGYGVGTFRFESARPGLTEQTVHAHETWLQLAAEASPLATFALVALALTWVWTLLYGAKKWPWPDAGVRAALLAACVAGAANAFLESNLIYTGIGVVLFLVIGAGLQTSTDGTLPEYSPKNIRYVLFALGCVVPIAMLWHTASVELAKANAAAAIESADRTAAQASVGAARSLAPGDGEAMYLASMLVQGPDRVDLLKQATAAQPSTRYFRAYARAALDDKRPAQALRALERALERDPNNLPALTQMYETQADTGDLAKAVETAKRLVAVENTVYFQTRAIPELVPLNTYDARVFLALHATDRAEKTKLLRGAVEGYDTYFKRTATYLRNLFNGDESLNLLGHSLGEVKEVGARAKAAAQELRQLYSESGDAAGLSWLAGVEAEFADD